MIIIQSEINNSIYQNTLENIHYIIRYNFDLNLEDRVRTGISHDVSDIYNELWNHYENLFR